MLPIAFINRMKTMLGEDYEAFLSSYSQDKYQALRRNPLKAERSSFSLRMPFELRAVPWEGNGYYYNREDAPGKHPYHEAGVYYIQEPSAMAPVPFLEIKSGERVLDLCAAPGGKSTQIGAALQGEGLLVCNEIHPARARILSENVERMGITNAIVTNETPDRLAEVFGDYFDKILVDAPCSGEGMFRKNEEAVLEWSPENVNLCAERQDHILDKAAEMLCAGGRLVYSTCTFAPQEDEGSVFRFLMRHPEFSVVEVQKPNGFESGNPQWCDTLESQQVTLRQQEAMKQIQHTMRIWPHKVHGEGHYLAVLQKSGDKYDSVSSRSLYGLERGISEKEYKEFLDFKKEYLKMELEGVYLKFGDQLYLGPKDMPALVKLKVLRPGLHLGTLKKNRFEPSHALALAAVGNPMGEQAESTRGKAEDMQELPEEKIVNHIWVNQVYDLSAKDSRATAFIAGQTFPVGEEKGWYLITVDGYSLGWGKAAGGIMKNHYPKGLRK